LLACRPPKTYRTRDDDYPQERVHPRELHTRNLNAWQTTVNLPATTRFEAT
jgi:hypothetical protein